MSGIKLLGRKKKRYEIQIFCCQFYFVWGTVRWFGPLLCRPQNCLLTTWWSPLHQLYKISKKVALTVLHQIDYMNICILFICQVIVCPRSDKYTFMLCQQAFIWVHRSPGYLAPCRHRMKLLVLPPLTIYPPPLPPRPPPNIQPLWSLGLGLKSGNKLVRAQPGISSTYWKVMIMMMMILV